MAKPLFWHQGLYLQPQHFQLKDIYDQSLVAPYNKFIIPDLWGIGKFEFTKSSLSNFIFNIEKGEFLFSDMTFVTIGDNAVAEARSFEEAWTDSTEPLMVYLGLKKNNLFAKNVTVVPHLDNLIDVNTRFVSAADSEDIADLHHNGPSAAVKKLNFFLKIFFEPEIDNLGNYELIPIALLERGGQDIQLSKGFIPPCVTLSGSENLLSLVKNVYDQLKSKGRELERYKSKKRIHTAEFSATDMLYFFALRSFNRYIPVLEHLIESPVHPWYVYSVFKQIIGELSSFSEKITSTGETEEGEKILIKYNHRELGKCFSAAANLISELMHQITAGPDYIISVKYDGTYYSAPLEAKNFKDGNGYYLFMETKTNVSEIKNAVDVDIKIGSDSEISDLISRSLPGLPLKHISDIPPELPHRHHGIYFAIEDKSEQWEAVKEEKNISIYWESPPNDIKIELMIAERK